MAPPPGPGRVGPISFAPATLLGGVYSPAHIFLSPRSKAPTFLKDMDDTDDILTRPLPKGITYVATFMTYDDLMDRNILQVDEGFCSTCCYGFPNPPFDLNSPSREGAGLHVNNKPQILKLTIMHSTAANKKP